MRWIISFFYLFILFQVVGQEPYYITYTVDDGLPSNEVYDIEIDSNGVIWYATDRGIGYYDGYDFINFTSKDGIGANVNFEIYKDWSENLWFCGNNESISYYKNGKFTSFTLDLTRKIKSSTLWIDKMTQLDSNSYLLTPYTANKTALKLTIKNNKPIISYFQISESNKYVDNLELKSVIHYRNSRDNTIYYPTCYEDLCVQNYNSNLEIYGENIDTTVLQTDGHIENVYYSNEKELWVATSNGFYKVDIQNGQTELIQYYSGFITGATWDLTGGIWLSSLDEGIVYIPNIQINKVVTCPEFNRDKITSIIAVNDILFIANNKGQLFIQENGECRTYENLTKLTADINLKYNSVMKSIYSEADYNIHFDSADYKIEIFNKEKATFNNRLIDGRYFSHRAKWLNIRDQKYFKDMGVFNEITFNSRISTTAYVSDSIVLVGTSNGLYSVNTNTYKSKIVTSQNSSEIRKIEKQNEIIWFSTMGDGLGYIFNDSTYFISKDTGLSSNFVESFSFCGDSAILVSSNKGIDRVGIEFSDNKIKYNVKSLNLKDGLFTNQVKGTALHDGDIWGISFNEIIRFNKDLFSSTKKEVPLNISKIYSDSINYSPTDNIVFANHDNNISINYIGYNYKKNIQGFYKYALVKNSEKPIWTETGRRNASFRNLDHGKYTFIVNAKNQANEWNRLPKSINFTILPHFSDRIWFRLLLLVLSILSITLVMIYFQKRTRKRQSEKLALESAKLRANQAELSALRNQMNPHFIYNSLNSIQNFIFKEEPVIANRLITKFSRLVRNSLNFSRLEYVSLEDELSFLQDYIDLEQTRFPNLFEYSVEVEDDILDIEIPPLMIQPLIENAIKHGINGLQYKGLINVSISLIMNSYIEISIEDNGRGESAIKGNSLSHKIIRDRIKIFKSNGYDLATLTTHSKGVNKGFVCKLVLPAKHEA